MKLREIAHARAGDKGNTCNICVVPYDEALAFMEACGVTRTFG